MTLYQIENTDVIFTSPKRAEEWLKMNNRENKILCFEAPMQDYCRLDYRDKSYIYVKNDKLMVYGNKDVYWVMNRLPRAWAYSIRARRLSKLPEGKKVNHWYHRN